MNNPRKEVGCSQTRLTENDHFNAGLVKTVLSRAIKSKEKVSGAVRTGNSIHLETAWRYTVLD